MEIGEGLRLNSRNMVERHHVHRHPSVRPTFYLAPFVF